MAGCNPLWKKPVETGVRLRVGAISFLNSKPLIYSILHSPSFNEEFELSIDVPSRLADELKAGNIDVGLISVIEYFRASGGDNPYSYRIIPDISISSRGAVRSILLLSRVPISQIESVGLDTNSRTSRALVRILLAEKYGLQPVFSDSPPSIELQTAGTDAILRIGDAALRQLDSAPYSVDLGAEWHELTGLPFVYACWVARGDIDIRKVTRVLQKAKENSMKQIPEIARVEAESLGFSETLCLDYLTNCIFYDLGNSEIAGMLRFYQLAQKHNLAPPGVQVIVPSVNEL